MASLTGTKIKNTYDSLLKTTDNEPLDGTLRTITDGLGNNSALSLSTYSADVTGDLFISGALSTSTLYAGNTGIDGTLSVVGDYVSASGDITLANGDFIIGGTIYAASNITHLGDNQTNLEFATGQFKVNTGGLARVSVTDASTQVTNPLVASSTLAVTGNLTVDTNTLYVDAANNRVGVGTSSPVAVLTTENTGAVTFPSNDGDYSGFGLFIKAPKTVNTVNSAIGFGDDSGRKYAAIGLQTYADADQAGLNFYVQPTASGSSAALNEAMRIDSSGRVGIGTSSPDSNLVVNGSSNVRVNLKASDVRYGTIFADNGVLAIASITSIPLVLATNDTERMRIDSSGNVGIGTATVSANLHLSGSSDVGVRIKSGSSALSYIDFADADSGTPSGSIAYNHISDAMTFATGGSNSERMRINSSGNVGIGTVPTSTWSTDGNTKALQISTRTAIFEAFSGAFLGNNIYFDGDTKYRISSAAARLGILSGGEFQFMNAPTGTSGTIAPLVERMRIDSSGTTTMIKSSAGSSTTPLVVRNSGSASVNTESRLFLSTVAGDDRGCYISSLITSTSNDNALILATNSAGSAPTERMRITSGGDVLIGETGISSLSSPNTLRVKGGIHTARGQFSQGGASTGNIVTLANESKNQTYLLSVRQAGGAANNVMGYVIAYAGSAKAIRMAQDNTNPVLDLNFTVSGLTLQLTTGSGFGTTTWDWVLTRLG